LTETTPNSLRSDRGSSFSVNAARLRLDRQRA